MLSRLSCSYRNRAATFSRKKIKPVQECEVCLDRLDDPEECSKEEYVQLLRSCSSPAALLAGRRVHSHAIAAGKAADVLIANTVVQMYGACGSATDSLHTFEQMQTRNVFSWCILLTALARNGHVEEATSFFRKLPQYNVVVWNTMLTFYAREGDFRSTQELFDSIPEKSTASWNSLISAYAQRRQTHREKRLLLFRRMDLEGSKPDYVTFLSLLDDLEGVEAVTLVHSCVNDLELQADAHVATSLVNAYGKCGDLNKAEHTFEDMPCRTLVTWNAMLTAYAQNGHLMQAGNFFEKMPARDAVSWNMILMAHSRFGRLEDARKLLDEIPEPNSSSWTIIGGAFSQAGYTQEARSMFERVTSHNVVSWTALISSSVQNGDEAEALRLFKLMDLDGVEPNHVTLTCVLNACASLVSLPEGRLIHSLIVDPVLRDNSGVVNALVNMYANCGQLSRARSIFEANFARRTLLLWTSLITAYAKCGFSTEAVSLYREMCLDGEPPDMVTFTSILSACSHSGLAQEAMIFLDSVRDNGYEPSLTHLNCIVDLLGRAGKLQEAEELLRSMPFEPDFVSRTSFLSSCRVQNDRGRGSVVASDILQDQDDASEASSYLLLDACKP